MASARKTNLTTEYRIATHIDSRNDIRQQIMKVVCDLEVVLCELKTVVDDIKVLVGQIDRVTSEIDFAKGTKYKIKIKSSRKYELRKNLRFLTGNNHPCEPPKKSDSSFFENNDLVGKNIISKGLLRSVSHQKRTYNKNKRDIPFQINNTHGKSAENSIANTNRQFPETATGIPKKEQRYHLDIKHVKMDKTARNRHEFCTQDGEAQCDVKDGNTLSLMTNSTGSFAGDEKMVPLNRFLVDLDKVSSGDLKALSELSCSEPQSMPTYDIPPSNSYSGIYERDMEEKLEAEFDKTSHVMDTFMSNDHLCLEEHSPVLHEKLLLPRSYNAKQKRLMDIDLWTRQAKGKLHLSDGYNSLSQSDDQTDSFTESSGDFLDEMTLPQIDSFHLLNYRWGRFIQP